jgi:hypothetical protein
LTSCDAGYDEDTWLLALPLTNDPTGVFIVIWTIIGILLVIALVVFIFRMLSGRRAA